jgi:hypothetical protein
MRYLDIVFAVNYAVRMKYVCHNHEIKLLTIELDAMAPVKPSHQTLYAHKVYD